MLSSFAVHALPHLSDGQGSRIEIQDLPALLKSHFTIGFRYSDVLHHIQVRSKMEALNLFSYLVRDSPEQKGDVIGCLSVISGSGLFDFHSLFSFQLQSSRYGTDLSELQVCCSSIYHHIKEGR